MMAMASSKPLMAKNHLKWPTALQKAQHKNSERGRQRKRQRSE